MAKIKGQSSPFCYSTANFIVLKRIKQALGLDQAKAFLFGAAPLKKSSIEYFASLDMILMNFYGLSETSGGQTAQNIYRLSLTATGFVMEGVDFKLDNPDESGQGEVCFRGRSIMMGYLKNAKASQEVID